MTNIKVTVEQQLRLLKGITERTGIIHEAQALQLRTWPLLIPNVTKAQAKVDSERRIVTFECTSKGLRPSKKMKLTCQNIAEWTKAILWNDTDIEVIINNKVVFRSDNE